MECLNCGKRPATQHPSFGYMPCAACIKKSKNYKVPPTIEITTGEIKESRKEHLPDTFQKYRGDTPSLEYINQYGTDGFTKEELREARNVWTTDLTYYPEKQEERYDTHKPAKRPRKLPKRR